MSQIEFDENMAKALEVIYGTRDVLFRRHLVQEAIAAAPGERVLDVGCGPGFYLAELLERVGPEGHVAGVDTSAPMLAIAAGRVAAHDNVEVREAPATALPFEDDAFDGAVCVQVLEYVEDVALALGELRRVLRPGGRLVVWDVDWATVSMYSADPARMQQVLEAWDNHLVHRSLPQSLARSLREAGFEDVALTGHAFASAELTPDAYGGSLVTVVATYLAGLDDFPREVGEAWANEQWALGAAGDFYFACVQCCATGIAGAR